MRFDRSALKLQWTSRFSDYNHVTIVPRDLQLPGWALEHREEHQTDTCKFGRAIHPLQRPHRPRAPRSFAAAPDCHTARSACRSCATLLHLHLCLRDCLLRCSAHPPPTTPRPRPRPRPQPPPSQPCQTRLRKIQPSRAPHRPMRLNKVRDAHSTALRCAATSLSASCVCA